MSVTRILNVIAIAALVGSAVYVYRIKYQAAYQAEEVARLHRAINKEHAAIEVLKAEWARRARPDRVQILAAKHLGLAAPEIKQRTSIKDLPMRPAKTDAIADTIASLGIEDVVVTSPKDDPIARTIEALGLAPAGKPATPAAAARSTPPMRDPTTTGSVR